MTDVIICVTQFDNTINKIGDTYVTMCVTGLVTVQKSLHSR
jgi:hypothetical protein